MSVFHEGLRLSRRSYGRRLFPSWQTSDCEPPDPANTVTDRLNILLNSSGPGYVLRLCPGERYLIQTPIFFAAPNQEISTLGYPTGDQRATLVVNGPVSNGTGHTTAINGTCPTCSGVAVRNIQIDGTRNGAPHTQGGGNLEMGGPNSDQLIEYVHSYDPRGWTCLHIDEGPLNCTNITVQNNDIGPCGSDDYQQWADGISVSCRNSVVKNNMVQNPTDGGIVLFGSPGTQVYNNTIWVVNQTLLGGINLVDYEPFEGDFTSTVIRDNLILGGFATNAEQPGEVKGVNQGNAIIKIGIAVGPRVWFGKHYGNNVSRSGTVINNRFSGAFGFGMAVTSAQNFTIQGNSLTGNTTFIGSPGPKCGTNVIPNPSAFVLATNLTQDLNLQSGFQKIPDGDSLVCIMPPNGGDYWPFLGDLESSHSSGLSRTAAIGISVGLIGGVIAIATIAWFLRRWAQRREIQRRVQRKTEPAHHT